MSVSGMKDSSTLADQAPSPTETARWTETSKNGWTSRKRKYRVEEDAPGGNGSDRGLGHNHRRRVESKYRRAGDPRRSQDITPSSSRDGSPFSLDIPRHPSTNSETLNKALKKKPTLPPLLTRPDPSDLAGVQAELFERGEDIDVADYAGNTPLQIASLEGFADIVQTLIQQGATVECCNTDKKDTPLIDAVENGHLEVVKLLLDAGANPRQANVQGKEPLDVLRPDHECSAEIKSALLSASKNWQRRPSDDQGRQAPPTLATATSGPQRATSAASPQRSPPVTGPQSPPAPSTAPRRRTARSEVTRNDLLWMRPTPEKLRELAGKGDMAGVATILNVNPKADAQSLIAAAQGGHDEVMQLLLGLGGADADPKPVRGFKPGFDTPMLAAIGRRGNDKVIQLLLDQPKFDAARKDHRGFTYHEIAKERQGLDWEREYEILKEAHDAASDRPGERSGVPVRGAMESRRANRDAESKAELNPNKPAGQDIPKATRKESTPATGGTEGSDPKRVDRPASGKLAHWDSERTRRSSNASMGSIMSARDSTEAARQMQLARTRRASTASANPVRNDGAMTRAHEEFHSVRSISDTQNPVAAAGARDVKGQPKPVPARDEGLKRPRKSSSPNASAVTPTGAAQGPIPETQRKKPKLEMHVSESRVGRPKDRSDGTKSLVPVAMMQPPQRKASTGASTAAAFTSPSDPRDHSMTEGATPQAPPKAQQIRDERAATYPPTFLSRTGHGENGSSRQKDGAAPPTSASLASMAGSRWSPGGGIPSRTGNDAGGQEGRIVRTEKESEAVMLQEVQRHKKIPVKKEESDRRALEEDEQERANERKRAEEQKRTHERKRAREAEWQERQAQEAELAEREAREAERQQQQAREEERARADKHKREQERLQKAEEKRVEQKRLQNEAEKKRAEEEARQRTERVEAMRRKEQQERARREALPYALKILAELPRDVARSNAYLAGWTILFVIKLKELDPHCPSAEAGTEMIANFQAAILFGVPDLALSSVGAFSKRPVTEREKVSLWRTFRAQLQGGPSKLSGFEGEILRDRITQAKFRVLEPVFWIKLSAFLEVVPRYAHLSKLQRETISIQHLHRLEPRDGVVRTDASGWTVSRPNADGFFKYWTSGEKHSVFNHGVFPPVSIALSSAL
ncbi:MAG: Set3 complex subunit with deacetylase activity, meiotic-specific repressor of sporulation proteins [Phylliscum demangeonii]|nr:MAG: Set3 complex subunit with deacetylase activity, meiotic-specific repressor of sporulation proteins [Phylliscum demangeonii]